MPSGLGPARDRSRPAARSSRRSASSAARSTAGANWPAHPSGERDVFRAVADAIASSAAAAQHGFPHAGGGRALPGFRQGEPIVAPTARSCAAPAPSPTSPTPSSARSGCARCLPRQPAGLPNQQIFIDRLAVAQVRSRSEGAKPPTVIVIALDNFKRVMPSSHSVGDSVLLALGRRVAGCSGRRNARPAQGDSFGVVLYPRRGGGDGTIHAGAGAHFEGRHSIGTETSSHASVGVAALMGDHTPDEQLRQAEAAVYQAAYGGDYIQV